MKKISSDSWILVFCGVLILIVLSIIFVPQIHDFVFPKSKPKTETYNGFIFEDQNVTWITTWQNNGRLYILNFHFTPKEVENITIDGYLDPTFNSLSPVYVSFDSNAGKSPSIVALAAGELSLPLTRALNFEVAPACSSNDTLGCDSIAIASCGEANKSVIYLRVAKGPRIIAKDTCVILEGEGYDLLKAVDNLVYRWMGIIK